MWEKEQVTESPDTHPLLNKGDISFKEVGEIPKEFLVRSSSLGSFLLYFFFLPNISQPKIFDIVLELGGH